MAIRVQEGADCKDSRSSTAFRYISDLSRRIFIGKDVISVPTVVSVELGLWEEPVRPVEQLFNENESIKDFVLTLSPQNRAGRVLDKHQEKNHENHGVVRLSQELCH